MAAERPPLADTPLCHKHDQRSLTRVLPYRVTLYAHGAAGKASRQDVPRHLRASDRVRIQIDARRRLGNQDVEQAFRARTRQQFVRGGRRRCGRVRNATGRRGRCVVLSALATLASRLKSAGRRVTSESSPTHSLSHRMRTVVTHHAGRPARSGDVLAGRLGE